MVAKVFLDLEKSDWDVIKKFRLLLKKAVYVKLTIKPIF